MVQSWLSMTIYSNTWHSVGLEVQTTAAKRWTFIMVRSRLSIMIQSWLFMTIYPDKWLGRGAGITNEPLRNVAYVSWWQVDYLLRYKVDSLWISRMIKGRAWGWNHQQTAMKVGYLLWYKVDYMYEYLRWQTVGRGAIITSRPVQKSTTYYDTKLTIYDYLQSQGQGVGIKLRADRCESRLFVIIQNWLFVIIQSWLSMNIYDDKW